MKSKISNEWRREIERCATDYATGHYLICERSLGHLALMHWISEFLQKGTETKVEEEVVDYFKACSEPKLMEEYEKKYEVKIIEKDEE